MQQFDNDLLAPIVFGKNLELHPLVVLAGIVGGSTLFGAFGAILAVPITAMTLNVIADWRAYNREGNELPGPADGSDALAGGDAPPDPDAARPRAGGGLSTAACTNDRHA